MICTREIAPTVSPLFSFSSLQPFLIKKEFDRKHNPSCQLGIASWGGILVVMWHLKPNTSSISTWAKWPFFYSNLLNSMHCATQPGIHPKSRTAAELPNARDWNSHPGLREHYHLWNFIVLFCTGHYLYQFVVVIKVGRIAYISTFLFILYSIPPFPRNLEWGQPLIKMPVILQKSFVLLDRMLF